MNADRRAELLAVADRTTLIALAERYVASEPRPTVVVAPEVGTIVLEVRDPIAHDRFHLSEVLACRAEVLVEGGHGWAIRLGDDRMATLAAAICDAAAEAGGSLRPAVEALCADAAALVQAQRAAEWAELAPTEVTFEELD